jgi:hypothetical protein
MRDKQSHSSKGSNAPSGSAGAQPSPGKRTLTEAVYGSGTSEPAEIAFEDRDRPVELALEVPPLPLPRAGRYAFKLLVNGNVIGTAAIDVRPLAAAEPGP